MTNNQQQIEHQINIGEQSWSGNGADTIPKILSTTQRRV